MASEALKKKKEFWGMKKKYKQDKIRGGDTYTVQAGDSWSSIAGKLFGDQRFFEALMAENGGASFLRPGMKIDIPMVDTTQDPTVSYDAVAAGIGLGKQYAAAGSKDPLRGFDPNALTYRAQQRLNELGIQFSGGFGGFGGTGAEAGTAAASTAAAQAEAQAAVQPGFGAGRQDGRDIGRPGLQTGTPTPIKRLPDISAGTIKQMKYSPPAQADLAAVRGGLGSFDTLGGVPGIAPPATQGRPIFSPTGEQAVTTAQQPPTTPTPSTPAEAAKLNQELQGMGIYKDPPIPYADQPFAQAKWIQSQVIRMTQDVAAGKPVNQISFSVAKSANLDPVKLANAGYSATADGWVKTGGAGDPFGFAFSPDGQTIQLGDINLKWDQVKLLSSAILPPGLVARLRNQGGRGRKRPSRYQGRRDYRASISGLVNWRAGFY